MDKSAIAQTILGPEWDTELLARLRAAVLAADGTMSETSWGLGGSQEIATYCIDLPGGRLVATSETYVGLTLTGPAELVKQMSSWAGPNNSFKPKPLRGSA